jgi:hypothetical protein
MYSAPPLRGDDPCILVEGPRWGDAEFFGRWLLAADRVNTLWNEAVKDPKFRSQVSRLEVVYHLDFGTAALAMLLELREQFVAFTLCLDSEEGELFAMMAELGFFVLTGERYQMVIPTSTDISHLKEALLRFAKTEDAEYWLHPEHLVTTMPFASATAWQSRLLAMDEQCRNADRILLLSSSIDEVG